MMSVLGISLIVLFGVLSPGEVTAQTGNINYYADSMLLCLCPLNLLAIAYSGLGNGMTSSLVTCLTHIIFSAAHLRFNNERL